MDALKKRFPLYSKVVGLYPADYRNQFADQILQTAADMLDDAPSRSARIAVWTRIAADLPQSITRQQVRYIGSYMQRETPDYVVRNSIIAAILLTPFTMALAANSLTKLMYNTSLYNSWLWQKPVLAIWVLILPATAFTLTLASYAAYVILGSRVLQNSAWQRVLDIKHVWPVLVCAAFAFGILFLLMFHDSAQCWFHGPQYLFNHLSQSWKCTIANKAL